jgi:predicted HTH transcriptional regulator
VRPEVWSEVVDGQILVGVFVPGAQAGDKPVFFSAQGLPPGAYRRIGSSDQRCTDDDLLVFYQGRHHHSYDVTPIQDVGLADLDPDAIAEYRRERARANATAEELQWADDELLLGLGCLVRHEGRLTATVAGVLLFGSRATLRRVFPMMRLDYIRVPGREWIGDPEHRFETLDMRDPLMRLIRRGEAAIMDDMPKQFRLPEGQLQRSDELAWELAADIRTLKRRTAQPEMRSLIYRLCVWRPLTSEALAKLLQREQAYIVEQYLAPMVRDGELAYTIPGRPTAPRQAYRATLRGDCQGGS